MENETLVLTDENILKVSMNFKKSKFALYANLTTILVMLFGIITTFLLFDYE